MKLKQLRDRAMTVLFKNVTVEEHVQVLDFVEAFAKRSYQIGVWTGVIMGGGGVVLVVWFLGKH